MAVPVFDEEDRAVVAALGFVVHSTRADLARLVPSLRSAAAGISRRLAATWTGSAPLRRSRDMSPRLPRKAAG